MTLAAAPLLLALNAASPEVISFQDAVQKGLALNPTLRSAQADITRAYAVVEQARAPSLPTLSAAGTYTRVEGNRELNGNILVPENQGAVNATLTLPLIVPNRWAQWRRAEVNADAVKAGVVDVRRLVALQVARTWLSVLAQHRVVEAEQRGVETSKAHLDYATNRRQGGVGNKLDEARAAQELAVAQTQVAEALGQLERLQEQLGVAVGVDNALDVPDTEPELNGTLPKDSDKPLDAAEARPDVIAAHSRVTAADVSTRWDWSDYTPLLTAVVQPGYQTPPTASLPMWNFQALVVLTLPIYDGGLRYGQEKERKALLDQSNLQLEATLRQATSEVRAGLNLVRRADQALQSARVAAREANGALGLAQEAFRAGGTTNLEVIDAERTARDADTSVAVAEDAARQARLELLGASGRFPDAP